LDIPFTALLLLSPLPPLPLPLLLHTPCFTLRAPSPPAHTPPQRGYTLVAGISPVGCSAACRWVSVLFAGSQRCNQVLMLTCLCPPQPSNTRLVCLCRLRLLASPPACCCNGPGMCLYGPTDVSPHAASDKHAGVARCQHVPGSNCTAPLSMVLLPMQPRSSDRLPDGKVTGADSCPFSAHDKLQALRSMQESNTLGRQASQWRLARWLLLAKFALRVWPGQSRSANLATARGLAWPNSQCELGQLSGWLALNAWSIAACRHCCSP
jgi:hypothetical protein